MARIPLYERAPLLQTGTQVLRPAQFAVEPRSAIGEGLMDIGRAAGSFAIKLREDKKNLENMNTLQDLDNIASEYQLELKKWQDQNRDDASLDMYEPKVAEYTEKLRGQFSGITDPETRLRVNSFINRWDNNMRTEAYVGSVNQLSQNFDQKWNQSLLNLRNTGEDVGLMQSLEYGKQKGILSEDQYNYKAEQLNGARRDYDLSESDSLFNSLTRMGRFDEARALIDQDVKSGLRTDKQGQAKIVELDYIYRAKDNTEYWNQRTVEDPKAVEEEILRYRQSGTTRAPTEEEIKAPTIAAPTGSKVTHYGQADDPYSDSNSIKGIGAFGIGEEGKGPKNLQGGNYLLQGYSMAVSPDVEKQMTANGIKPGDWVNVTLADGTTVTKRWDDRTADTLTGRVDFYTPVGGAPELDRPVSSIKKAPGPPANYVQPPRFEYGKPVGFGKEQLPQQAVDTRFAGLNNNQIAGILTQARQNAQTIGNNEYTSLKFEIGARAYVGDDIQKLQEKLDQSRYLNEAQKTTLLGMAVGETNQVMINHPQVVGKFVDKIDQYRQLKAADPNFDPKKQYYFQLQQELETFTQGRTETELQNDLNRVVDNARDRSMYSKLKTVKELLKGSVLMMEKPVTVDIESGFFTEGEKGVVAFKESTAMVGGVRKKIYTPDLQPVSEEEKAQRLATYNEILLDLQKKVEESNFNITDAELQNILLSNPTYIRYAEQASKYKQSYTKQQAKQMRETPAPNAGLTPPAEQAPTATGNIDMPDDAVKKAREAAQRYLTPQPQ